MKKVLLVAGAIVLLAISAFTIRTVHQRQVG